VLLGSINPHARRTGASPARAPPPGLEGGAKGSSIRLLRARPFHNPNDQRTISVHRNTCTCGMPDLLEPGVGSQCPRWSNLHQRLTASAAPCLGAVLPLLFLELCRNRRTARETRSAHPSQRGLRLASQCARACAAGAGCTQAGPERRLQLGPQGLGAEPRHGSRWSVSTDARLIPAFLGYGDAQWRLSQR
jgi:hypothetical protein